MTIVLLNFLISDKYVEIFNEMFKTGVQVSASPPRRSTALRQQFAIANSTTDSGLLLFPKNLLFHKIFSGALIIFGVLGAYFTRPSPPRRSTALRQQFAIANSTTDSGLLLFPKNLLLRKIFSGALE